MSTFHKIFIVLLLLPLVGWGEEVAPFLRPSPVMSVQQTALDRPFFPEEKVRRDERGMEYLEGDFLIRLRPQMPAQAREDLQRQFALRRIRKMGKWIHFRIPAGEESLRVRDFILQSRFKEWVEAVTPNYVIRQDRLPNDTFFRNQWGLKNDGSALIISGNTLLGGGTAGADIRAESGWDQLSNQASDMIVAVIDSGIDLGHPDLVSNLWENPGEIGTDTQGRDKKTNLVDDDQNGCVDDVNGCNFITDPANPTGTIQDADGHGTMMSGIIASHGNNREGTAGVLWRAKIMMVKFSQPSSQGQLPTGTLASAVAALDYAIRNGAVVTNNSYSFSKTTTSSDPLEDLIRSHPEVAFIVSAGNQGRDNDSDPEKAFPASYDLPNVIAVASTNNKDELSTFSNFGATSVDIAAPGESILSPFPTDTYAFSSGTSASAAFVSGAVAGIKFLKPDLLPTDMRQILIDSARKPTARNLDGKTVSGGIVHSGNAYQLGIQSTSTGVTTPTPQPASTTPQTSSSPATGGGCAAHRGSLTAEDHFSAWLGFLTPVLWMGFRRVRRRSLALRARNDLKK